MNDDDLAEARALAEEIVSGITSLPIDPIGLAKRSDIEVKGGELEGASGVLLYSGGRFGILYSTGVTSEAFQRFSVAHELGHYHLPGHPEALLDAGVHYSKAHFASDESYERQADHFAANLLMPRALFLQALDRGGEGLDAVISAADECGTSIRAAAIRFVTCTSEPAAIIVSKGRLIEYCFMSDALKAFPDLTWIRKNTPLPRDTTTYAFNLAARQGARRDAGDSDLQLWFEGDRGRPVLEEVMLLAQGRTLTLLHGCPTREEDEEEREQEEDLEESWTPKFRR